MGRVLYGHKLLADSQHKGIRTGVCVDLHFHLHWKQYPGYKISSQLSFKGMAGRCSAFYHYDFQLDHTYLDMTGFGKGSSLSMAITLARFWEVGPTTSLCASWFPQERPIA